MYEKRDGAEVARKAHNLEVLRSKRSLAILFFIMYIMKIYL